MFLLRLCLIDQIWFLLAVCFFLACCLHCHTYPSGKFERFRLYQLFQDIIRYGKTKKRLQRPDFLRIFDIPKRWFFHFYTISVIWNGLLIFTSLRALILGESFPAWLDHMLTLLKGSLGNPQKALPLSVVLVQVLLWIHSLRRLLECLFLSVFSDGVIHLAQYCFGLGYYVLLGLTALCVDHLHSEDGSLSAQRSFWLQWYLGPGVLLFLWASFHQHKCLVILARLRTSRLGKDAAQGHAVPHGDWFALVSCPHYLAELLIYVSLGVCSGGGALSWWLVVLYVLCNQALAARLSHEFYCSKFPTYPKHRKAFIPYLF
ncbi:polyprenal reductase isoform X1 [Paramormyrops kingsleyae]|uniref:Polyprenal reductase n=2 Tax=Paramormyrops kingsleyae TaxID=1676925 RepID=A0A3B3RH72_9TELE|nr:polyprenol reductase isoform X1 [Paramormyrops kingsleyae]